MTRRGQNTEETGAERGARRRPPGRTQAAARVSSSGQAAGHGLPRRLAPRKLPGQDRSRATVEAILEAAVDLLSAHGYARTSTNRIAVRAGISVGSLYQYFPNKDAIVTALFERHAQSIAQIVAASLADLRSPDVTIRDGFRRMLLGFEALHEAHPKMARAVDPHVDGRQQLSAIVNQREEHFRQELCEVLRARPDVRRGDHAIMASFLFEMVEAIIRSLMHGDARRFDRPLALEEATEAMCRYIEAR